MLNEFKLDLGFADDPSWALADILEFVCGNAGGDVVVRLSIRGYNARWPLGLRVLVLYGSLRYVGKVTMFVNMMSFFCYFFEFVRNLLSCDLAAHYIIVLIMFSY